MHVGTQMSTTTIVPRLPSLKRIRESRYLTQQMLANRAGLSIVTIARLEGGHTDARFSTLHKLARALKVKPDDLVHGAKNKTSDLDLDDVEAWLNAPREPGEGRRT